MKKSDTLPAEGESKPKKEKRPATPSEAFGLVVRHSVKALRRLPDDEMRRTALRFVLLELGLAPLPVPPGVSDARN